MKATKDLKDIIIILVLITIIFVLSSAFHWVEWLRDLAKNSEVIDVVELLYAISLLSVLSAIFAFRRWNELKVQLIEKEQIEQDLKDSEQRLLSTVDLSPDTIIIHREKTIVFMNKAGVYLFRANTIEDILGRNILDFFHPYQVSLFNDRIEKMHKSFQKLPNIETLIKRIDDTYIDVEISSTPITYHDFPHIITIIRDITERKENEQKLKESEERLYAILDNTSAIVFIKDLTGNYILINHQFEKIFKISKDKIKWKNDYDIFPKDFAEQFSSNDNKVILTKSSMTVEEIAPQLDGLHTYLSVKFPLFNSVGDIYAICGIATDITERKKNEETRSRLASIVEATEDAIISYELNGIILTWNPGAEKIFGYNSSEVLGKNLSLIIPAEQNTELENLMIKVRKGLKIDHYETKRKTKDNKIIDVSLSIAPIKDDKNNITAASAIGRDITFRKTIENEMRKYAEELALYNEELYVFSYAASHDLQEPLRNIQKFINSLKEKYYNKFDNNFKEQVDSAEDGTVRMNRLITDFLSYSRVTDDRSKYENTDFNSLLKDAIDNLKTAVDDTSAKIYYTSMPKVFCNSLQMTQVFQNLISNAIKYKSDNPPEIKIGCEKQDVQWMFWVSDNGIGIEQWFQERIFLIFQKLHDHKKYPGSGIGLALCKRIIEKHGGKIWFESEAGTGTTFYFTIPIYD